MDVEQQFLDPRPESASAATVQQTAYFDSSEPLPPGVDYPEGPEPILRQTAGTSGVEVAERPLPEASRAPALLTPAASSAADIELAGEAEFQPLLNGTDLAGWQVHDGKVEAWQVAEGVLRCRRANGGWLRTEQQYSDFELRFDVRLAAGANTGIGLRFPAEGSPTLAGIEVQLIDDTADKYASLRDDQYSGSLYYQIPPLERRPLSVGSWHAVRLLVHGDHILVVIDGEVVNDIYLDQLPSGDAPHPLRTRPPLGFVGLQSSAQLVEFRNIRIRDLATRNSDGLATIDLATGTGDVCPVGARVTVDYIGRFTDGKPFDSSYDRGEPVTVGLADVIEGWQAGIPGMRVGGRRKLIVPADLAYGNDGVKDLVPPGATLVFEVELRRVER